MRAVIDRLRGLAERRRLRRWMSRHPDPHDSL